MIILLLLIHFYDLWTCDDKNGPGFFKFMSIEYANLNNNN